MAALQIRAIAVLWLWFAPCHEQKSIGLICTVRHATPHWRPALPISHVPFRFAPVNSKHSMHPGVRMNQLKDMK
jgi:hypothetical protein